MYEATRWGHRGATINSISPGIIITPLANDELHGPRKDGYLKMIEGMPTAVCRRWRRLLLAETDFPGELIMRSNSVRFACKELLAG